MACHESCAGVTRMEWSFAAAWNAGLAACGAASQLRPAWRVLFASFRASSDHVLPV
ncbi:hypothetical protein A2U01_0001863 [Trifolium medium]|uniref:Uncharacterized protein n=2 Tax=Trifolium TaxID=3898 RepID=A0A2K3NS42_TRIPR|nr:hypothetical protein [Trifolium medium]PNY05854.1 hypothetical protein L195_g002312 [Trifolium pratense]